MNAYILQQVFVLDCEQTVDELSKLRRKRIQRFVVRLVIFAIQRRREVNDPVIRIRIITDGGYDCPPSII